MGDPRNVAHAKKVSQEKHHKAQHADAKKPPKAQAKQTAAGQNPAVKAGEPAKPQQTPDAAKLEKSLAVLANLKELEFHSRANIEKLAELSLTIEDELKQKSLVGSIGDVYSAQEAFHSKIATLIEAYQAECDRLKPPA
jgi:hypothetical protein